jgi:cytochrome c-type biogenesis protein CcmH/NrfG
MATTVQTPLIDNQPTEVPILDSSATPDLPTNETPINWGAIALGGLLVLLICYITYNVYCKWKRDQMCEVAGFAAGQKQERDDTAADFDLDDTIKRLEKKQAEILKNISSMSKL